MVGTPNNTNHRTDETDDPGHTHEIRSPNEDYACPAVAGSAS